jgi:hypothetical protein
MHYEDEQIQLVAGMICHITDCVERTPNTDAEHNTINSSNSSNSAQTGSIFY